MSKYKTYIVNRITEPPTLQGSNAFTLVNGGILYGSFDLEAQEQLEMVNVYEHDDERMSDTLFNCNCKGTCKVSGNVIKTDGFFGDIEIEYIKDELADLKEDVQNIKHNMNAANFKLNEITAYIKQLLNKDGK